MNIGKISKIAIALITIVFLAFLVFGFVIAYEFGHPSAIFVIRVVGATVLYVGSLIGYYIFKKPLVFIFVNCAYIALFLIVVIVFNNSIVLLYYSVLLVLGLNLGFSLIDLKIK